MIKTIKKSVVVILFVIENTFVRPAKPEDIFGKLVSITTIPIFSK